MILRILLPLIVILMTTYPYCAQSIVFMALCCSLGASIGVEWLMYQDNKNYKTCPYFGDRDYIPGCKGCKEFGVMDQCGDEYYYNK